MVLRSHLTGDVLAITSSGESSCISRTPSSGPIGHPDTQSDRTDGDQCHQRHHDRHQGQHLSLVLCTTPAHARLPINNRDGPTVSTE